MSNLAILPTKILNKSPYLYEIKHLQPNKNLQLQDLKTIQNSQYMQNLREQFSRGERPAGCSNCWAEEDASKTSKRMNSIYKMKKSLKNWTIKNIPTLKFFEFKFGFLK